MGGCSFPDSLCIDEESLSTNVVQIIEFNLDKRLLKLIKSHSLPVTPNLQPTLPSCNNVLLSEPIPSTNKEHVFSPEALRPYPKPTPRKIRTRGRTLKKSAIYIDTPEKEAIRKEHEERQKRLKNKQTKRKVVEPTGNTYKIKGKGKGKGKKDKTNATPDSSEEDEYYCPICLESYSESRSGESCIQCQGGCKLWSHVAYTDDSWYYICHNCCKSD